ncbi:MAG: hypothetical protein ACI837_001871 [Crocinitomicaceae bacterium]|jgi:hypothetical protein
MSKKKHQSKSKSSQLLDADLLDDVQEQKVVPQADGTISLDEFSRTGPFAFNKANTKFLLIGLAINIIGFILMIGGATEDITKFDANAIFSETRITIAPIFIVAGYIVMLYAIMKRPKTEDTEA